GLAPLAIAGQLADPLTRKAQAGIATEAEPAHRLVNRLATDIEGDLADTDVGRVDQDAGQVEHRPLGPGHVLDGVAADLQRAVSDLNLVLGLPAATLQSRRHGDRLDRGTRLEHIDHGTVAHGRGLQVAPVVGVIGRLVDHGEHLAGLHIDHHQAAGLGTLLDQRVAKLAVRQILQAQINRQGQSLARLGILLDLYVLDQPTTAILEYLPFARHTGQPFLEGQLDALAPAVVD